MSGLWRYKFKGSVDLNEYDNKAQELGGQEIVSGPCNEGESQRKLLWTQQMDSLSQKSITN